MVIKMEVKPATTLEEQIAKLKSRGCIISDETACVGFLQRVNYYRASAYFLPFRNPDQTYKPGTTFEKISGIYDFDQKMRSTLFPIIEEIEINLRATLSYYHAHKHGVVGYLDADAYNPGKHKHEKFIEQLKEEIRRNSKSLFVKHHLEKYGGIFPIWVAIELFSMGMLSHFYSDLHLEDRKTIAASFHTKENYLSSWLHCMTILRNICAHYGRLYYTRFSIHPKIPPPIAVRPDQKLFTQIFVLKLLFYNHSKWDSVYMPQLKAIIERYSSYIELKHIGFPVNWEELLLYNTI